MRTTLTLPEDVYEIARSLAYTRRISLGDAIAELIRQAQRRPVTLRTEKGFPVFDLPADAPPITLEQTLAAGEDW